ncbi:MAG: ABC transporter ATP-binding protein [Lachnospiraceae bacterium]
MLNEKIEIRNLTQRYGRKTALQEVSLSMGTGMHGLLGRNGAGKTTLMRTMVGLLPVRAGEISLCQISVQDVPEIRKIVGYLPQEFSMYPNMKVYEVLDYIGVLSEMPKHLRESRIEELLHKVNLYQERNKKVKSLSGGMKRRVGVAQALLHEPKIVIADEPTVGLDPEERVRLRGLLMEEAKDKIVILSTHIVEDIKASCEDVAILDDGHLVYDGGTTELIEITRTNNIEDAYLKMIHSREVE